ncbi:MULTISPECIES: FHA domain-containing protein [unclassified Agrococcus]|uniref:FHA domain-containing protein n=1 Tax=unclassified Agrococcus TaxID=2615065 RepID=UPI00361D2E5C
MIRFDIDLSVEQQGEGDDDGLVATVAAAGTEIVVTVDDASRLPNGGRRMLHDLAAFADDLAGQGVSVRIDGPDGMLVAFGDVHANAVQRLVTGSQHVRVGSPAALVRVGRGARQPTIAAPPTTMLPIAPTLGRRIRRRPTTTHAAPGSGRPRLVFAVGTGTWDDAVPYELDLTSERTRVGSGPDVDLRLPGLEPLHAEIVHRDDDEYVLVAHGPIGGGAASRDSAAAAERILRTGARIEMGPWRLAYLREEWADHGRPYGGRQGGELSYQRRQPPRRTAGDEGR